MGDRVIREQKAYLVFVGRVNSTQTGYIYKPEKVFVGTVEEYALSVYDPARMNAEQYVEREKARHMAAGDAGSFDYSIREIEIG